MGRGTKMTPQQKGKRSKGEFAIIPFLDFMDSVDMVDMKIAFPIFPFSHHDIFHKNRDRSSTKQLKKTKVYLVVMVYQVFW